MPDFWQFPTGSMGLGPITAIYQARFMRYLENRGILETDRRARCGRFVGDGEMDEPESLAGLSLAAREGLDNLIFVVNCNLQRLDGPVRGNGSIVQELEGLFAGAGWNVIKLLWGSDWDPLFARDDDSVILKRLHETVDGEFQKYAATDGALQPRALLQQVSGAAASSSRTCRDEDIDRLRRGGHDPVKIYAAYHAAAHHKGQPDRDPRQDQEGLRHGPLGPGQDGRAPGRRSSTTRRCSRSATASRCRSPTTTSRSCASTSPAADSPEMKYLHARREALGGYLPARTPKARDAAGAGARPFARSSKARRREQSTTMVFVQHAVAAAEGREASASASCRSSPTRRAPSACRRCSARSAIYSPLGQLYEPEDQDELLYYKEAKDGQILEEGITEAGAISSWIAAATSY